MLKKQYKVFHLIKGLGRGGAEVLLSEGLRCADRSRFSYGYGYFLPWKDALVDSLLQAGAPVTCFNSREPISLLFSVPRVSKFLKQWGADLVHCHLPLSGVVGRFAGRLSGIPVVYTEHNVQERYHPWTRRLNILTWRLQTRVIAVSHKVARSIEINIGSRIPVHVVQNGIPVALFERNPSERDRVREELEIPPETLVVGAVAALRVTKNLNDWLKTARLILDRYPDAHFLIVGDGPLRAQLQASAVALSLSGQIHFLGLKENIIPYLSAMDVYMISSMFEGLPIALLEAMAMELPVVSTDVGGVAEAVVDGKTGFLVNPNDPEALFVHVCTLLENSKLRHQFGSAGRALVQQHFDINRMTDELEHIYMDILEKNAN